MAFCDKNLRAMTLIEMIVAMAILAIVMAAVVPQIYCVQNSWAHTQSNAEILQNGRVLMDHFTSSLGQAKRITAVSAADVANGFIEYLDSDDTVMRYDISPAGYVEFGQVGSLSPLAGPATKLRFVCYGITNPDTPTADINKIRCVSVEAVIADAADAAITKTFTAKTLIRANTLAGQTGINP